MAPSNFSIEGRAFSQGFRDIQRTWLWELVIDGLPALPGIKFDSDRLLVHWYETIFYG
jgi:hypothetical protein